jgi:hypothetical protein
MEWGSGEVENLAAQVARVSAQVEKRVYGFDEGVDRGEGLRRRL